MRADALRGWPFAKGNAFEAVGRPVACGIKMLCRNGFVPVVWGTKKPVGWGWTIGVWNGCWNGTPVCIPI